MKYIVDYDVKRDEYCIIIANAFKLTMSATDSKFTLNLFKEYEFTVDPEEIEDVKDVKYGALIHYKKAKGFSLTNEKLNIKMTISYDQNNKYIWVYDNMEEMSAMFLLNGCVATKSGRGLTVDVNKHNTVINNGEYEYINIGYETTAIKMYPVCLYHYDYNGVIGAYNHIGREKISGSIDNGVCCYTAKYIENNSALEIQVDKHEHGKFTIQVFPEELEI